MTAYTHILVPVDFSQSAERALETAMSIGKTFDATLTLFHVYLNPIQNYGYVEGVAWPTAEIEHGARVALDALVERTKPRYPKLQSALTGGEPWREVVDFIEKSDTDLVVMGTHGRRGVKRLILGSVAEKVVRMSPVPVLIVPGPREEASELGTGAKVS